MYGIDRPWQRSSGPRSIAHPIDLLVANAGISGLGSEDPRAVITTNIDGVLNSVEPVVPLMEQRRKGQIAIMSSLAGFRSLPNAPLYCASKSAVRSFGEGLGVRLAPQGVSVTVLCPGFIETPLTEANPFPMPLIMSADAAAERLLDGIRRKKARVAFPATPLCRDPLSRGHAHEHRQSAPGKPLPVGPDRKSDAVHSPPNSPRKSAKSVDWSGTRVTSNPAAV